MNIQKLNALAMLADWQLVEIGENPTNITIHCLKREIELNLYRTQQRLIK